MSAVSVSGHRERREVADRDGRRRPRQQGGPRRGASARSRRRTAGIPSARPTIDRTAALGQPGHEPRQQRAHRRLRQRLQVHRDEVALAGAPVGPPVEQLRARQRDDVDRARSRVHSSRWSTKSSRPRVGAVEVLEHHDHGRRRGQPLEERAPGGEQLLRPDAAARCRAAPAARARSSAARPRRGRARPRSRRPSARVVGSSSVSSRPARPRTISPSAQKLMPSP